MRLRLTCALTLLAGLFALSGFAAETRTFTIREPFGLAWGPDRVSYAVEFPDGKVVILCATVVLDANGKLQVAQFSDITPWPGGKFIRHAALSFMAALKPDEVGQWTWSTVQPAGQHPVTKIRVAERPDGIELTTGKLGIRLAGGSRTFPAPVPADQVPAPIQAVRLADGKWIGKGWWKTELPCVGYRGTLVEQGPVFARVLLEYDFADGEARRTYRATVELSAGQDVAIVSEEFDLSKGKRYPMPELSGVKPGDLFEYVMPTFASKKAAMMWDWWSQTHGRVPSPNAYCFSLYGGLEPDSCEWSGRMYHEAAKPGDGGLAYGKDGRVISLNAYFQWGEDESYYFAAYNSKKPETALALIALRPSQWLHPDINPHPVKTLVQYTQTNNLWIERRTAPDLFLRAPVGLGKRVYGIGVLPRTERPDAEGKKTVVASDAMLRHVRLGRLDLDRVKDWVLDYEEASKYPRLFVDAGDLDRMRLRVQKHLANLQHIRWISYLCKNDPKVGKQLVEETVTGLQKFVEHFATSDYGHMMYAINTGVLAHQADVALAVPEITPEQRAKILRYVAANLYNSLSPDYVPPREAGFAWGSANMMSQLRARAGLMASLLPNHPEGKAWRSYLTEWLTGYAESQINAGGATLECPHYSSMVFELGIVPLLAMGRCGEIDMAPAIARYRAAARTRLGTLLPWDLRGNFRSTPPIGDGYYDSDGTFATMAALFEKADPKLAKELMWGVAESGRSWGGHPTPIGLLLDPDREIVPPDLGSEHYAGMGFVMRSGFPRKDETFFLSTAGSFSVGHGHSDRGAWIFYSKGAPLMVDFAAMYTPSIGEAWLHAGGLSFDHDETLKDCPGRDQPGCFYTGKVWQEHKTEPFTCLEPGWDPQAKDLDEAMGKVETFVTLPTADFAVMRRPIRYLNRVPYMLPETHGQLVTRGESGEHWAKEPFVWTRRYILVKSPDPMGIHYLVFRDDLSGNKEFRPALNLWCLAQKLSVVAQGASWMGQHEVDLDCFVAEPRGFTHRTHRVSHKNGFGFGSYYQKEFGKPFEEAQILCQIPQEPGKGGYFAALVPRKRGEMPPIVNAVLDSKAVDEGHAILLVFPNRADTVLLTNQPVKTVLETVVVEGTAFVVTKTPLKLTVTMLAPGTVTHRGRELLAGDTPGTIDVVP